MIDSFVGFQYLATITNFPFLSPVCTCPFSPNLLLVIIRLGPNTQKHTHALNAVHSSNLGTLCRVVGRSSTPPLVGLVLIQREEMQKRQRVYQSYTTRTDRPTE